MPLSSIQYPASRIGLSALDPRERYPRDKVLLGEEEESHNFRLQISNFRLKGRFYPLMPVRAMPEMKYF